jgi:hypothetical protein
MSSTTLRYSAQFNPITIVSDPRIALKKRFNYYCNTALDPAYGQQWPLTRWQREDMWFLLQPANRQIRQMMWLYTRGGGKTRNGVMLAIFLGYQKHEMRDYDQDGPHADSDGNTYAVIGEEWNRVVWYAAGDAQKEQALDYFKQSRYVESAYSSVVHLKNGNKIKIRICSLKQANSPRADYLFLDEEQDMDPKIYAKILGTAATSPNAKYVHMGTTEFESVLEDNFQRLNPLGLVRERHIDDCTWTTVEKAMEGYEGVPDFIVKQQLWCEWARPGGVIFEDVEVRDLTEAEYDMIQPGTYYGMDPNPKSGHAMVETYYLGEYDHPYAIYVDKEIGSHELAEWYPDSDKSDTTLIAEYIMEHLKYNTYFEIEGQHGEELYKILVELRQADRKHRLWDGLKYKNFRNIQLQYWNEEEKLRRVYQLRQVKIIIHPRCKETIHHVQKMAWDPNDPKGKVFKTPDMHFGDGFLHAPCRGDMVKINAYS